MISPFSVQGDLTADKLGEVIEPRNAKGEKAGKELLDPGANLKVRSLVSLSEPSSVPMSLCRFRGEE